MPGVITHCWKSDQEIDVLRTVATELQFVGREKKKKAIIWKAQ